MASKQVEFDKKHKFFILETIYESEATQTCFYKAKDMEYDRTVGIKIICFDDFKQRDLLLQEARSMIKLEEFTDKIPSLYEYHIDNKNKKLILVMQYIDGLTLREIIKQTGDKIKDPYVIRQNIELIYQISLVLGAIHTSAPVFQHKDLKPENIIVKNKGQLNQAVYLIDLGITGRPLRRKTGTPLYQSPEQRGYLGFISSDNVDVFSLGLIFFEILTGKQLRIGVDLLRKSNEKHWVNIPAVTDYNENVPPIYNDIISKCLQLMPDKRYRNGMEVAKAINYALKRKRYGR
ncbi:serine/threonine protein kinase [Tepidanaerobacter sp. GT38]|uniref:serine/threonine-protein kinase n=1 Tax=Tepidanaerobacter sp. GT38 TaxID=2722793 RepID=UPI001F48379C|nr:serine/threonine-protein kinase [Tepidanaerobacter sp. GT38]MCG1011192.1 serine/threonine protein kinase [Tepidanaerobacter sp. GT38]